MNWHNLLDDKDFVREIAKCIYEGQHEEITFFDLNESQRYPWYNSAKALIEHFGRKLE